MLFQVNQNVIVTTGDAGIGPSAQLLGRSVGGWADLITTVAMGANDAGDALVDIPNYVSVGLTIDNEPVLMIFPPGD